jgi:hypothetical protein
MLFKLSSKMYLNIYCLFKHAIRSLNRTHDEQYIAMYMKGSGRSVFQRTSDFLTTDPEVRVPALPHCLSSESGTGSTQPRGYN